MFSSIIDLFKRVPFTALILFYGFIPSICLVLTVVFIMLHIGVICPITILDLLFDKNDSVYYKITFQFIDAGMGFIGYFIDVMFKIIEVTFDALLGEDNFLDSLLSQEEKCPAVEIPEEVLENAESMIEINDK